MKQYMLEEFNEDSFVDETILKMYTFLNNKKIVFETNGAALNDGSYLSKSIVTISSWHSITGTRYNEDLGVDVGLVFDDNFAMRKIVKFDMQKNTLHMSGLEKNGDWIEVQLTFPAIIIYGDPYVE